MVRKSKRTKRKTKSQKKAIKNRRESKKYIELMNLAYKQITSSYHDIFDKDDYLLLSYIKQGIKKGWKILHDTNIIKEINCNSLCMTMSILNSTFAEKKLDKLHPVQELYLFFVSYFIGDKELSKKEVSLKHAIRKIDKRIMLKNKQLMEYEKKKDNRNIKKCKKYIERQEKIKKQLIETEGVNKEGIEYIFRLDVCDDVDCQYLHEYKMEKGEKWNETYSKFCLNITEIFKGVVWLNIYMIFNRTTKIKGLSPNLQKIETNLDIRGALKPVDIVLIPSNYIYESDLFYKDNTLDRARKKAIKQKEYWVYHDFNKKNQTFDKRSIRTLENKHYIAALMSLNYESDWKSPKEIKEKEMYNNFQNFLQGKGKLPVLKEISKKIKNIGGNERFDLQENIENSITLHWVYVHKSRLNDFIEEYLE